jgi:hypothetical protein
MRGLRKIIKWTAIIMAAAITILLLLNAYFVWSTGTRLEKRLVALRQAGDPVQIPDLAREPIPPDQNADVFWRRAADALDAIQKDLEARYPKKGYPTETLSPAEQDKLEKLFTAYPKVMPLLEQAAACPDCDPQLDCTLPPFRFLEPFMEQTSRHRLLYRVLRARSALLLSRGRLDDALTAHILALRLARHWRREPFITGFFVTAVCEQLAMDGINQVLQAGPVAAKLRHSLDRELALHDTMEGYDWALRSERAFALSSARELPGSGFWQTWLTRGFVNDLKLQLIELFDRFLVKGRQPYREVVSDKGKATSPGSRLNPLTTVVRLLEPALNMLREPAERTRAMSRSLRVLNAVLVRVAPGSDRAPKLDELGLPRETTTDPFSGEPLRIKKLPEGWMVYSVGSNLVDDGGKLDGRTDVGVGPISRRESGSASPPRGV